MRDPRDLIYLPPRAAAVTLAAVERRSKIKSVLDFGVPTIDSRFNPGMPGDVITFLARPGHCKTTTAIHLAHVWCENVRQAYQAGGNVPLIVYFTLEVPIEDFVPAYVARDSGQSVADVSRGIADVGRMRVALVKNMGENLCVAGHADKEYDVENIISEDYFPSIHDLNLVLQELLRQGYSIGGVIVDFLQYLGDEKNRTVEENKTGFITKNFMMCKALAMRYKTTFVVCAQAARQVDKYAGLKFPEMDDCQWSSAIEQVSNKLFSFTMPGKYMELGKKIICNGFVYEVTENLLAIKKVKERFGRCDQSDVYMCHVNLVTAELTPAPVLGEVDDENEPDI